MPGKNRFACSSYNLIRTKSLSRSHLRTSPMCAHFSDHHLHYTPEITIPLALVQCPKIAKSHNLAENARESHQSIIFPSHQAAIRAWAAQPPSEMQPVALKVRECRWKLKPLSWATLCSPLDEVLISESCSLRVADEGGDHLSPSYQRERGPSRCGRHKRCFAMLQTFLFIDQKT
jgi:hypothetical protein